MQDFKADEGDFWDKDQYFWAKDRDWGGQKFGRYEVKGILGEGGFAKTYAAEDPLLGRTVALKIYETSEVKKILNNEAAACGRLSHPNISVLHDYVEQFDAKALVFEMVPGKTLETAGPWHVALRVFADIARALAYSHSKGVIHCDVKPRNVKVDD